MRVSPHGFAISCHLDFCWNQDHALGVPTELLGLSLTEAAALPIESVLDTLATSSAGLSNSEVSARLISVGENAVRTHSVRWPQVLFRQLRSPLLILLAITSFVSYFVGEHANSVIIGAILAMSVGLGFMNEYRAELAAAALHSMLRRTVSTMRDGHAEQVDVAELVPGDIVNLLLGEIVPADIRLLSVEGLECDESILTGESLPASKSIGELPEHSAIFNLTNCAFMGTEVSAGGGHGVVVSTGGRTEFGKIAIGLGTSAPETAFQVGLRRFSSLLMVMAGALTSFVFIANLALQRPWIDALLFSLAIAVGITPQLLPAIVSASLAKGARELARRKVLVKRLISIEDLGDVEVLFTDKTGTLTEGRLAFMRAIDARGYASTEAIKFGLLSTAFAMTSGDSGNPLDQALWESPAAEAYKDDTKIFLRLSALPFDHRRRMNSVIVEHDGVQLLVTKGAPESVLPRCIQLDNSTDDVLTREFRAGGRVIAVATREWVGEPHLTANDERDLTLMGFLVFRDAPKSDAGDAVMRLSRLGIEVKIITGDNPIVTAKVCEEIGLKVRGILTGAEIDHMDEETLRNAIQETNIFARISPEQKAQIVKAQRRHDVDVAFLGDGVNDALALHAADVGISVEGATDVAKDAPDIVLLEKDLHILADGVIEGRRTFTNTIKYILMGASSNFGNMFSAAGASTFLSFLPMLPSQILLNNLLYDASQLAISSDAVDPEQLRRPSQWDIGMIRRYMLFFGPISSLFDFSTFAILLWGFHAGPTLFRSGWFVESLATQTLVIFVIRTRRSPFFRSQPSLALLLAALTVVVIGFTLPYTPLAKPLGFQALSGGMLLAIIALVGAYLWLVEMGKRLFFNTSRSTNAIKHPRPLRHVNRRASRFPATRKISTKPRRALHH